MTKDSLKEMTKSARVSEIQNQLLSAAQKGRYEATVSNLLPEQLDYLTENDFNIKKIEQKNGVEYTITWQ